jgi:hypothetical protein
MKTPFFLTDVAADWNQNNLAVIREVLSAADLATFSRSDSISDPLLDTPNLPNLRGVMRWVIVQKLLANAAEEGRFEGISAEWVYLGGVSILELRGANTVVTPYHLLTKEDAPRESTYRRSTRIENQINPSLWDSVEPEEKELLHLLLVHGGRDESFAFLRVYIDSSNRSVFRELSNNIMSMPTLLDSIDFEEIDEPQIGLNDADEDQQTGESQT